MDFKLLRSLQAQERQCVLPATEDWLQPAQTWLEARRFCEAHEKVNTKRHRAPDGGGGMACGRERWQGWRLMWRGWQHRWLRRLAWRIRRFFTSLYVRDGRQEDYDVLGGQREDRPLAALSVIPSGAVLADGVTNSPPISPRATGAVMRPRAASGRTGVPSSLTLDA